MDTAPGGDTSCAHTVVPAGGGHNFFARCRKRGAWQKRPSRPPILSFSKQVLWLRKHIHTTQSFPLASVSSDFARLLGSTPRTNCRSLPNDQRYEIFQGRHVPDLYDKGRFYRTTYFFLPHFLFFFLLQDFLFFPQEKQKIFLKFGNSIEGELSGTLTY